mmetsp:Transcript_52505/g.94162  ORF Transcript_52505/g.94162 Transcript_52505/m.94162 type:complete len:233 (-) Transcript_52505:286-984(-)
MSFRIREMQEHQIPAFLRLKLRYVTSLVNRQRCKDENLPVWSINTFIRVVISMFEQAVQLPQGLRLLPQLTLLLLGFASGCVVGTCILVMARHVCITSFAARSSVAGLLFEKLLGLVTYGLLLHHLFLNVCTFSFALAHLEQQVRAFSVASLGAFIGELALCLYGTPAVFPFGFERSFMNAALAMFSRHGYQHSRVKAVFRTFAKCLDLQHCSRLGAPTGSLMDTVLQSKQS